MISPAERYTIAQKCKQEELVSETIPGKKQKWWLNKHNPDNEIPKNIYLLCERDTIKELHDKYTTNCGMIGWTEFINYTRELIKQNIMM